MSAAGGLPRACGDDRRHETPGHVLSGRYKALEVEGDGGGYFEDGLRLREGLRAVHFLLCIRPAI